MDKEKILGIAQRYFLKGQSKKAVRELQKLVEAAPKDSRLRLKLGDLYLKNGENENAYNEYLLVAQLYEEEDLNLRAISIYKKILSTNPHSVEALRRIAKLYLQEGLIGSAKNCFQTILKVQPGDTEAMSALEGINNHPPSKGGKPVASEQQPPAPLPLPRDDIPIPPPDRDRESPVADKEAETHYHLGIAYREMELFDYAITEFEMASDDPTIQFDCFIMLGACYMQKGGYDKSIEYYKKASQIKGLPHDKLARLHLNLGLALEANGMVSEALDMFRSACQLDPSLTDAQEKIDKLQSPPR